METVGQSAAIGSAPWWGGGVGALGSYGRFADDSSNAVRINAGNRATAAGIENLLDQNQFSALDCNVTNSCNRVTDTQVNGEFRMADRLRDIEREMNANAREAAKRCCDAKVQSCQDKSEILAAIAGSESRGIERTLNQTQAELTSLRTQVACGCCTPRVASS